SVDWHRPLDLATLAKILGASTVIESLAALALAGMPKPMPEFDRIKTAAALRNKRRSAELSEERAIMAEIEAGRWVDRRRDVNPEILLECWR
ncbi:MAG: hypothetical protein KDI51_20320, partial [Xanthomonadales bacterium]|nr:hypothetical protein [Xanthomonadales bacterium]